MLVCVNYDASASEAKLGQQCQTSLQRRGETSLCFGLLSKKSYKAVLLVFTVAGLEQGILSPGQNSGNYFAPIPLEDHSENKVDILEMLQKAKVDLKPLLSSLSANKEKLRESSKSSLPLL